MESNVEVKVFPASNGESILIKLYGEKNTNILIDCGYISTYKTIKDELIELKKIGQRIDLLVLTHIDNDHINGARALLEDYIKDNICDISEIWFNDYFRICEIIDINDEIDEINNKLLKELQRKKYPTEPNVCIENGVGYKTANILLDYLMHDKVKSKINYSNNNQAFYIEDKDDNKSFYINNEVKITLIGPYKSILMEILNEWNEYLITKGFSGEVKKTKELARAFELFYINKVNNNNKIKPNEKRCSSIDDLAKLNEFNDYDEDIINRSSIAFILEFYDKKMLFLGDSSPIDYDEILEEIYKQNKENKIRFNLVKMSHHGSKFNISKRFFELSTSEKYLVSTNGSLHGHPNKEAIYKLIRNQTEYKKIIFNYKNENICKFIKNNKLDSKYNFDIQYENDKKIGRSVLSFNI